MTPADRVRRIMKDVLGVDDESLDDEAGMLADIGADILELVKIAMEIEREFDIEITEDDEAAACATVGEWIALVERKLP